MSIFQKLLIVCLATLVPAVATADEQTITLKVDGMSCYSCPYQVQSALKSVDGVASATASLDTRSAVVVFDDDLTTVAALTEATTHAGFPSTEAINQATE